MSLFATTTARLSIALLFSAVLASGCSSSSTSLTPDETTAPNADDSDAVVVGNSANVTVNVTSNENVVEPTTTVPSEPTATEVSLEPVVASLQLMPQKIFRLSWQPSAGAEFYRVLENPDGVSGFAQVSADLDETTTTFDHTVALYKRVNASYIVQACNASTCVGSDEQRVSGSLSPSIGYVKASNTDSFDFFGDAISLSADGNTLAIGAFGEASDANGVNADQNSNAAQNAGAVYVFERNNNLDNTSGPWRQQAYLKASNSSASDSFGSVVSLSADGNTLAVGAYSEDSTSTNINGDQNNNSAQNSGAVYVFNREAENWQQEAYLKANNSATGYHFGVAVSLSADGNTLAVGASREDSASTGIDSIRSESPAAGAGAAYVFIRTATRWQQQTYIKASNTNGGDLFGLDLSLSADGNTLAIGALAEASAATGVDGDQNDNSTGFAGAVYVFVRSVSTDGLSELWQQQAYVKPSNTQAEDFFGSRISLSADGNTLAVGASREASITTGIDGDQTNNSAERAGAVYVFIRSNGVWQQQAYVKASNTDRIDGFSSVSLSADGNTLAVGAAGEGSAASGINGDQQDNSAPTSGAVYIFIRSQGIWQQVAYLKSSNSDAGDAFGQTVSLSADGDTLAVGALFESSVATGLNGEQIENSLQSSGAVYLY